MRIIEQGTDKEGKSIWIVLEGAELIGIYYSQSEAQENLV